MSVEDFKHQFVNELAGLTAARITTLWKKSKTMSKDETLEAIIQSKTAQTRDQLRRLKTTEISDQTPIVHPVEQLIPVPTPELKQEPEPVLAPELKQVDILPILSPNIPAFPRYVTDVSARAMPDWSQECKRANIDLNQLRVAVNNLCSRIESQVSSTNGPPEMRILRLYQSVEDLLLLRAKRGNVIDVLSLLR